MRVLNVNSSLDFRTGGGTAERTFQMSRTLARQGVECAVLTVDTGLGATRVLALHPAKVVAIPLFWMRFYVPKIRWRTVKSMVRDADVVHLMGHWGVLNALAYWAARSLGRHYVVCPAGALPIFGRSSLLKHCYNALVGNAIIRNASAWIAITQAELPHFEAYGIAPSRVTIIPNGVCSEDFHGTGRVSEQDSLGDQPFILFMGRLNLIKGPDLLLDAFISVARQIPGYQLVFAGPDGGMMEELKANVARHSLGSRVHFHGHVEGEQKSSLYKRATLLVVPSRQEAMSIVALEAGICGTPVLLTDQCGFGEVRSIDARLEVPASTEAIARSLMDLLATPELLQRIAPLWERFVVENYDWKVIAPRYLTLYRDVLGRKLRA